MPRARLGKRIEENAPLCSVCIFFLAHLFDSDLHAVFCEHDVLLLHGLLSLMGKIVGPEVHLLGHVSIRCARTVVGRDSSDLVADECECADEDEKDDERNEIRDSAHDCGRGVAAWELCPVGCERER